MSEKSINGICLEICSNSIFSALQAQEGGASRVELCQNLENGGTTPSYGQLQGARAQLSIGIHALIRPRGGNFLYNDSELEAMLADIRCCKEIGIDGVVIGALNADGTLAIKQLEKMIDAAAGLHITFHRAFDRCLNPLVAMEQLIALGVSRILTSGQQENAYAGKDLLKLLIENADQRIVIMPGAGVDAENIASLLAYTGARAIHSSAKMVQPSAMTFDQTAISGMNEDTWYTSKEKVRQLADILKNL